MRLDYMPVTRSNEGREYICNASIINYDAANALYCVGLCNGMIPATAAACCKTLEELLEVGPPLVCVNLRMLFVSMDRSTAIEDAPGTWTVVTPRLSSRDHEKLIMDFVRKEV